MRLRLDWFNKLRWGAALGVLVLVLVFGVVLKAPIEIRGLLLTGAALLLLNTVYVLRSLRVPAEDINSELRVMKVQMVGDLVVLTILLSLSGGIENPLLYIYVIHVMIASLLFKGRQIFQIAWLAIFLFTAEVALEHYGVLPHHHLPTAREASHGLPFILLTLGSFWLVLFFCAYVGALIMRHNRAIKDELVARQGALMKADRGKTDFFRFVNHEIKSPVTTAQSAVETALELDGGAMSAQAQDLLRRAVGRLEKATLIVNNLAQLTRGGDLKPGELRDVDLNELVTAAVDDQRDLAAAAGVTIETILPDPPLVLVTSRTMMETIIANLVGNAVRYNRQGGRVSVRLVDAGRHIRLVVEDDGIGVAEEDQAMIFGEFYRTRAAQELSDLGTGLGLPIVRKFVDNLGGRIELESAPDQGSTFTVVLPRRFGRGRLR